MSFTRLRAAREAAGLSQPAMAARIGISESLLRSLESGRVTPTPRVAKMLRDALGEPAERLLQPVALGKLPRLKSER